MLNNTKSIGYATEVNVLGAIVGVDFLTGKVTLMDEHEKTHVVDIDEVLELREIGKLNGKFVYQNDVIKHTHNDKLYEVDFVDGGKAVLYLLDKKLNRVQAGDVFVPDQISKFEQYAELVDNIHVLRQKAPTVDFNIRVVRHVENGETTYYYVGNNKDEETVDLIKVVYMGHVLIEEADYLRETCTYDEYLEAVADGKFKEVDPMELANYVLGVTRGQGEKAQEVDNRDISEECCDADDNMDVTDVDVEDDDSDEEIEEIEDICEECGEDEEDCDCELW
jgi:hypothetical protein